MSPINIQMRQSISECLAACMPEGAVETIKHLIHDYQIDFIIRRNRRSKLGDFKPSVNGTSHKITINAGLNTHECLLVFLHELAHLMVHEAHGRRVAPHGLEWKRQYGVLIRQFVRMGLFHPSVCDLLIAYSYRVKASGIADLQLAKALRAFDRNPLEPSWHFLEEVDDNKLFKMMNGRLFRKEEKIRTRYRCYCLDNQRSYLIHPAAKVKRP